MSFRYNTLNNFYKGLNQDTSVDKLQSEHYYYMLNGSVYDPDSPGSSLSPFNVKGNKLFVTIPTVYNLWRIYTNLTPGSNYNFDITINSVTKNISGYFSDLNSFFKAIKESILSDPSFNSFDLNISYKTNFITIFSSSQNIFISANNTEIIPYEYITPINNPYIIGWGNIGEDIFIFTTNETSPSPSGSSGQIWKLNYDKVTFVPDIKLIYNSKINFSTHYPIPNIGGFVGIDETDKIKRIYWTDKYNPLRQLNVADPDLMSVDPENINLIPSVDFSVPRLIKIEKGGDLKAGKYWCSYRLKSSLSGTVTCFSPISFPVNITRGDESGSTGGNLYTEYVGGNKGENCGKSITWEVKNIDSDFSEIEFLIIKKEEYNSSGDFLLLYEMSIPQNRTVSFTFTGNENFVNITNTEFNALSSTFTHCNSIASKDNILYAANTYIKELELSDFDTRAYRAKENSGVYEFEVEDFSGNKISVNPLINFNIPEDHDAINPDHDSYIYDINGDIGGTGPNISYTFGVVAIKADDITPITAPPPVATAYSVRHTNQNYNTSQFTENIKDINNQNVYYPLNNINEGTKFVYYSTPLRQFQRGETYRFAFQAYNKSKDPYFAKWIADIKMPLPGDPLPFGNGTYIDGTPIPSNINDFRLSFTVGNITYVCFLYVKFTVNIPPSIAEKISGYNIVRVERDENNRTILGSSILTNTETDIVGGSYLYPVRIYKTVPPISTPYFTFLNNNSDALNTSGSSTYFFLFDSPDHQLVSYPGFKNGDKLKVVGTIDVSSSIDGRVSGYKDYSFMKHYQFHQFFNDDYEIENNFVVLPGRYTEPLGGVYQNVRFRNFSKEFSISNLHVNDVESIGNKTMGVLLKSNSPLLSVGNYNCTSLNGRKIFAYYTREVTNQYGGNTYSARSLNSYIDCSPFRPISSSIQGNSISDTFMCFGGDTYVTIYDQQKFIKHWGGNQTTELGLPSDDGPTSNNPYQPANNKYSISLFYPVECYCNPDLRNGIHPNVGKFGSDNGTHAQYIETYEYNTVYSSENNFKQYYPKPLIFFPSKRNKNRIHASSTKILGELEDSWSNFPTNQFIDTEGIYGEINNLIVIKNKLLYFQDSALGLVYSNDKTIVKDAVSDDFIIASSGILAKCENISNSIGSKHQFSFSKSSDGSVIFLDSKSKEFYIINSDLNLGLVNGITSYLKQRLSGNSIIKDNPFKYEGISSGWDDYFKQFIVSFNTNDNFYSDNVRIKPFCFSYNILYKFVNSFYSYNTPCFIKDEWNLFAVSPDLRSIYIMNKGRRGEFFNQIYPFRLDFLVNDSFSIEKIFDNIELNTVCISDSFVDNDEDFITVDQKNETFTSYRCYNNYQNTNWVPLIENKTIKRDKRKWNIPISGNRVKYNGNTNFDIFDPTNLYNYPERYPIPQRMKSNYLFVNLQYDNLKNRKLKLEDIKTTYRINRLIPVNQTNNEKV